MVDALGRESPKVEVGKDEWQCKSCTLVNKLPDYMCTVCGEKDDDAWDRYLKEFRTTSYTSKSFVNTYSAGRGVKSDFHNNTLPDRSKEYWNCRKCN